MDDKQDFLGKNPDLYEEVLISESLDQYEGLLNHSKSTKKFPQNTTKGVKCPSSCLISTELRLREPREYTLHDSAFCTFPENVFTNIFYQLRSVSY